MSRPKKATVDYFPHDCSHRKTIFIIESRYGNDGYAFWFKLLEMLGSTEGHVIDCRNDITKEFLQAKTRLGWDTCHEILDLLAKLEAIDPELWSKGFVWSDNFVNRVADVYKNRRVEIPTKPGFYRQKPEQDGVSTEKTPQSTGRNPQSKVKESKVKEIDATHLARSANAQSEPEPENPPEYPPEDSNSHVFCEIPLVDKTKYSVTEDQVLKLQELYPAVDVRQELRKIVGWNEANAKKRKTRRGILAHVNSWIAREQDRCGGSGRHPPGEIHPKGTGKFTENNVIAAQKWLERRSSG